MLQLQRAPQTDEELWWTIKAMWGVELPRVAVCPEHVSPFDAVSHAFFGKSPNFAVWYASRGSGKSLALAVLGLTKAFIRDISVTILGGSMTQSLNVREHMRVLMRSPFAPAEIVAKDQATLIEMRTGNAIKPLPASQTTVRGPHPPLSLLDEVDEMDQDIYEAALGQAMEKLNTHGELIEEYIVASSTWQNPEGTFTKVIEDAREKGLPVFSWCWRELLAPNGWMSQRFIDNKKRTVSTQMWLTEYELNEPSASSRALDLDKVAKYFVDVPILREKHTGNGMFDEYVWEDPVPAAMYAVGADWAKERDKTVIAVVRYDQVPRRCVKLIRVNRQSWDRMIGMFNTEVKRYQAVGEHDKTGLGSVVNDYVDFQESTQGFVMIGRKRTQMLLDYITSFEHGDYELPHIPAHPTDKGIKADPLFSAHRAVTVADVYAPGRWDSHLPDDFAAMALAHRAIERIPMPVTADVLIRKDGTIRKADEPFNPRQPEDIVARDGEVVMVDGSAGSTYELIAGFNGGPDIWAPVWSPWSP